MRITRENFDVIKMRAALGQISKPQLAKIYGTSYCTVYRICKAKNFDQYKELTQKGLKSLERQRKDKSEELKPIRGLHTDCSVASERVALIVAVSGNTEQPTAYREITELLYGDQLDTVDKMDIAVQAIFKAMQAKLSLLERTK